MQAKSINQNSVAGTVVLYNSPPSCFSVIETYLSQVDRLYVIDNSFLPSLWLVNRLDTFPTLVYKHFPQNVGIAAALNTAAQLAISDGYAYLLTMDDDSIAPPTLVAQMLDYLNTESANEIGIITPTHLLSTAPLTSSNIAFPNREVLTTMTSGNLLNLQAYKTVGPFDDALFIDVVDHEFNLRLKVSNYRIVELANLHLIHRLGQKKTVFGGRLSFVSHSPVRNYYLVRNSLAVAFRHRRYHPVYLLEAIRTVGIETVKVALFEDQRLKRLRLIGRAIIDGLQNRLGKLK